MKYLMTIAVLLALGSAASAKLTPYDGARKAAETDVISLYTGPDAAQVEQQYFRAPPQEVADQQRPGRCTVQTFVFTKMRLAQACY